jgi:hypothetical protein
MTFHAQHNRRLVHNAAGSAGHDVLYPLSGRRQCDTIEAHSPRSRCGLQGCNLERGRGTHAFIWRKVRRDEEIGPTSVTASTAPPQKAERTQHVTAPPRTLFLSAEKTKALWIAKVINPKFETGRPAKRQGSGVEDADQVICPRLDRNPHCLAKKALQDHASGVVDISTHYIETARSSRHP